MKKYIRAMLSDLSKPRKDFTPSIPAPSTKGPVIDSVLDVEPSPERALPDDLSNQILSQNPSEQVRQLDYQADRLEEEGTMPG
jgi:hypothetical protein